MIELILRKGSIAYTASLTSSRHVIESDVWQMGVNKKLSAIPLTDNKGDEMQVILCSDNELGKQLLKILTEKHTLEDAYRTVQTVHNANVGFKEALQEKIICGKYGSIDDLFQDVKNMTEEIGSTVEHFYFPLEGRREEEFDFEELDGRELLLYESEIQKQVEQEQDMDGTNMAEYYWGNEGVKQKLVSAIWSVKRMGDALYGCVEARMTSAFTFQEREDFKDWVLGQNSDGLGEGFEQRPIQTDDGDLFVSFWSMDNNYQIYDSNEMSEYLENPMGVEMGGI